MASPSAAAIETEKNGIPRLAFSDPSMGSTTIRKGPSLSRMPASSETIAAPSTARRRWRITRSAAASIAVVSSPPSPSPTTGSRSTRVGSSTSTPRTSSTASRQSPSQSVTEGPRRLRCRHQDARAGPGRPSEMTGRRDWTPSQRQEQKAGNELRVEVSALLRHRLAALGDREDVFDARRPHEHGYLGLAFVHRAHRLLPVRCVADALVAEPVDETDVELAFAVHRELRAAVAIENGCGPVLRRSR